MWILTVALLLTAFRISAGGPLGDEFLINQLGTGDQQSPDVTASPDGGFLVVWQSPVSPGDDANGSSIVGRRLDSAGAAVGHEFQINTYTTYDQRRPRISSRGDGSFLVVWQSSYPVDMDLRDSLQARSFDSAGSGITDDFNVTTAFLHSTITNHDAGAASGGDFVVTFSRFYSYLLELGSVELHLLESDGAPISTTTLEALQERRFNTRIGGEESTGFVVSRHGQRLDYVAGRTYAEVQRLAPSGVLMGDSVNVFADQPVGDGSGADAVLSPDGSFVVAWNANPYYTSYSRDVYARAVSSTDVLDPAGPQQINSFTTGSQNPPRLAHAADGSIFVVWNTGDSNNDPAPQAIRARWLASDGSPLGDEILVNTYTTGNQSNPEVTASTDGRRFLVVWNSAVGAGDDVDGQSIRGRIFKLPGLFCDGFESGTTAAWSNMSP